MPSINLDNQRRLHTSKIRDVTTDRILATKLEGAQLAATKVAPEAVFRGIGLSA